MRVDAGQGGGLHRGCARLAPTYMGARSRVRSIDACAAAESHVRKSYVIDSRALLATLLTVISPTERETIVILCGDHGLYFVLCTL